MNIIEITPKDMAALDPTHIKDRVQMGDVFIVKKMMPREHVMAVRSHAIRLARNPVGWSAVDDEIENGHRIVDENPQSYVMQKCQRSSFYLWRADSAEIAEIFGPAYRLKARLGGLDDFGHLYSKPSSGNYSLVGVNHYPRGGGYLNAHLDPPEIVFSVHTIFNGSERGVDWSTGGLHLVGLGETAKTHVEDYWEIGDMLCFDAGRMPHGVDPVDRDQGLDWSLDHGRFSFSPATVTRAVGSKPVGSLEVPAGS